MSGEVMLRLTNHTDSIEVRKQMRSGKCEDRDVLASLLDDLKSPDTTASSHSTYDCEGNEWSVIKCGLDASSTSPWESVLLCLNCSSIVADYCEMSSSQRSGLWSTATLPPVSCSNPPDDPVGRLAMLYVEFDSRSRAPSFLSLEALRITNTSVEVTAVMSGPGSLVCAPYLAESTPPLSSEELSFQNSPIAGDYSAPLSSNITSTTFPLTGLVPSSSYHIYCAPLSFTSAFMATDSMLRSKIAIETNCCRSLSVELPDVVFDDASPTAFALTLDMGREKVTDVLTVSISGSELTLPRDQDLFQPPRVTFTPSSPSRYTLAYVPVSSGTYRVNISLSGTYANRYRVVFPAGDTLVVRGADAPLPPPSITNSQFTPDGAKAMITFTTPTDREGMSDCSALFSSLSSLSSPASFLCVWRTSSLLEISSIGPLFRLEVGHKWLLREGVLKARCKTTSLVDPSCSSWRSNSPQNTTISAPSVVQTPIVNLVIASEIGPCDDLVVDLTSSSGSGGRLWKSASFVVLGSSPNLTAVRGFLLSLSTNSACLRSPIVIPRRFLSPGHVYSLEVRLCNFLDGCGQRTKTFVVSTSVGVPVAVLNSQNQISIFRNSTLSISGGGSISACGAILTTSRSLLSFSWSMSVISASRTVLSSLVSESVDPIRFRLSAYRLDVGLLHRVTLTVRHQVSMKVNSASVDVMVKSGDLMCKLVGGTQLSLPIGGSLLLDLSKSYDSNVGLTQVSDIVFESTCFRVAPTYRADCDALLISALNSFGTQIGVTSNASSPVVTLNDVFQIVMSGRSRLSDEDNRRCETVITLSIVDSSSPVLMLEVLSPSGPKMNPSSKLKILGSAEMQTQGRLLWSVDDPSVELSRVSLSPISQLLFPGSGNVFNLAVSANSLPAQSTFIFTLSCSLVNGASSSSSVTITTNSPPYGGSLEVVPTHGVVLSTTFSFSASDWLDEDLPLSYQFGYLSSQDDQEMTVLRSKIELSHTSLLLPLGSSTLNDNAPTRVLNRSRNTSLPTTVRVFDIYDCFSASLSMTWIEDVSLSIGELRAFLVDGISGSQATTNSDDLKSTLSLTSSVLNHVNCSGAPSCPSLNRLACSLVEGTCGDCALGYVGQTGSSNTPCFPNNANARRLLGSATGGSCESADDCEQSSFLYCDSQSKSCQSIQQSCPNSCSGHGRCVFVSKFDQNVTLVECEVVDPECVPRCECDEDFLGSSCSASVNTFLGAIEIRELLVEGVAELMEREDADADNVKSWVRTLSLVGSDYLSVSMASKRVMAELAIQILNISRAVGLSLEDLFGAGLEAVVDMCVSGLSASTFSIDGADDVSLLHSLLGGYSEFLTSDMLETQDPVSAVRPNFRSSSLFISKPSASNSSLPLFIPESGLEAFLKESIADSGVAQQSIQLPSGLLFPLQISLIETLVQSSTTTILKNTNDSTTTESPLSLPLFLSFGRSPCPLGEVDCRLTARLLHKLNSSSRPESAKRFLSSASNSSGEYFDIDCVAGTAEDHYFHCSSGAVLLISCNGTSSLRGRKYCPKVSTSVTCRAKVQRSSKSAASSDPEIDCQIAETNSTMTHCVCNLSGIVVDDDSPVSFSILSIERSVLKEFVATWETSTSLSSGTTVARSWVVTLTVGGLGAVFVLMMALACQIDSSQKKSLSQLTTGEKEGMLSPVNPRSGSQTPVDSLGNNDLQLIEECLPSIFKSDSLWSKFKVEMKVYHRWLGILLHYSPMFPRSLRVLSLFSSIVTMLFVQSVTYNIADPDDGSCEACHDESRCLSLRSTLNVRESRCYWKSSSTPEGLGSCHFRDIGEDMTRMFIVAMISAIVSAPFALGMQYLILTVLSRETKDEAKDEEEKQKSNVARVQRVLWQRTRTVVDSLDLVESCGRSSDEDLKNLRRELHEYYQHLLKNNPDEAEECRGSSNILSFLPDTFPQPAGVR
jgi:hypothetical protein